MNSPNRPPRSASPQMPQNPARRPTAPHPGTNPQQNGSPRRIPQNRPAAPRPTREQIARRKAYLEKQRAAQRRERIVQTVLSVLIVVLVLAILLVAVRSCIRTEPASAETDAPAVTTNLPTVSTTVPSETTAAPSVPDPPEPTPEITRPVSDGGTVVLTEELSSEYAALISLDSGKILAQKNGTDRMYPASMTKVMTLLVAYEQLDDLSETFTVTSAIIDPLYRENASLTGFSPNEEVSVLDLMYGTVLPSGAESAVSLAICAAGSEEEFVRLMNEKAAELGLTNTHFTNCSGLHNADHYSTAVEIAMILDYTMQYETCREILSTYQYTSSPTEKHPEGVAMTSTMLSRMYGDEPDGVTIHAGKTGYTPQAGQCLCSYATDDVTGEAYIFVSSGAQGKFEPVFDAITAYSDYTP